MDERLLEIREYKGEGYKPLIDYGDWRVAILRPNHGAQSADIDSVERHNRTDEVFVLLNGFGVLFIGDGEKRLERLYPQLMEQGKLYNIKRSAWHTIFLSPNSNVLIIENRDTGVENTDFFSLQPEHKEMIIHTAKAEQAKWQ